MKPQKVAELFTPYGDVTVVKAKREVYWVEFESLDQMKLNTLNKVATQFKSDDHIKEIKMFNEADRFKSDTVNNQ